MDDEQDLEDDAPEADGEAEYAFEGFRVEFNERVALTPPAAMGG